MGAVSLTTLIEKAQEGDGFALDAVYHAALFQLRSIARSLLLRERAGHTLQATALVNELFLKLHRMEARILSEEHFYRLAARAMRQVLIDYARVRGARKHVPPEAGSELWSDAGRGDAEPELRLAARIVFDRLRSFDPRTAETVWLRSVEGLTIEEVSLKQCRKVWRVRAEYEFGLQWMSNELKKHPRT